MTNAALPLFVTPILTVAHVLFGLWLVNLVVAERTKLGVWHGDKDDEASGRHRSAKRNAWADLVHRAGIAQREKIPPDHGALQRKASAFRNFAEYTPLALILLLQLEIIGLRQAFLWVLGIWFFLGRVAHARGLVAVYGPSLGRAIGFFSTVLILALSCLVTALLLALPWLPVPFVGWIEELR
jgi:uncharacterized protein